jgi:hypothetical protein
MISDEMAIASDCPRQLGIRGHPSTLEEEARPHIVLSERGDDRRSRAGWTLPPARVLGVKRKRDTQLIDGIWTHSH